MGNWKLTRWQEPKALTTEVLRELRTGQPAGLSRRQLIRRSIGADRRPVAAGGHGRHHRASCGPTCRAASAARITLGDLDTVKAQPGGAGRRHSPDGAPSYFPDARTYVTLLDPTLGFQDGDSPDGVGAATNVRTLYQRCPHLGCKPNFCTMNYWFECPCHGSRYDRLGTKVQELGPAPRSLDRFAHTVEGGVLTVDTSKITLGPLPVPLGQPGLIPAKSPTGCI